MNEDRTITRGMARLLLAQMQVDGMFSDERLNQFLDATRQAFSMPCAELRVDPEPTELIYAHQLEGFRLDFWAAKAMGWVAATSLVGPCYVVDRRSSDGEPVQFNPTNKAAHAEKILEGCKMELKPPAKEGENWEAWFDRKRITGAVGGNPPAIGAGADWKTAVARAVVVGRFGDTFDPDNPVDVGAGNAAISVGWGTARAIQTEPGAPA